MPQLMATWKGMQCESTQGSTVSRWRQTVAGRLQRYGTALLRSPHVRAQRLRQVDAVLNRRQSEPVIQLTWRGRSRCQDVFPQRLPSRKSIAQVRLDEVANRFECAAYSPGEFHGRASAVVGDTLLHHILSVAGCPSWTGRSCTLGHREQPPLGHGHDLPRRRVLRAH